MADAIIGVNVKVEIQSALGSALTVTAVTAATPPVATSTAHGLANGDVVVFTVDAGMVELDGQAVRVANVAANTFELEGIIGVGYTAWTAGTAKKVTTFATFSKSQNITMPNPAPARIDTTTLIDKTKQYMFGLPDAPQGTIKALYNPNGTAEALIFAATKANLPLVFRVTFAAGQKTIFNANVSGGTGFTLAQNAAADSDVAFSPRKDVMAYAT